MTVGLLRQSDEPVALRDPMPGLAQVPALLASFERAGLAVSHTWLGITEPLEPAVDLAAYRIVQESLTNVRKHAGADDARLFLHYHGERLDHDRRGRRVAPDCTNPTRGRSTG